MASPANHDRSTVPPAVQALVEQTRGISASVSAALGPSRALRDFVEQTRSISAALGPSRALRDFAEQTRAISAGLAPSPALRDFAEQTRAISAGLAPSPALREFAEQSRAISASINAALGPSQALRDFAEQTRAISAGLIASPAWRDFADTLVAASDTAALDDRSATYADELVTTAVTVMTTAAAIDVAVTVEADDQLETYDFSGLLDPRTRRPIQATVAVVVFIQTFAWVVSQYDLASQLNTLAGAGPLLAAQLAWSMTGKILARLDQTM